MPANVVCKECDSNVVIYIEKLDNGTFTMSIECLSCSKFSGGWTLNQTMNVELWIPDWCRVEE